MTRFRVPCLPLLITLMLVLAGVSTAKAAVPASSGNIKKVLYIGDSMTGWLSERLNAYGAANGFEVSTVMWDGSTIRKWGNSTKLKSIIDKQNPDVVFVSLGLNELLEHNPERRLGTALNNILKAVGNRKLVWVGPPSWPGKGKGEKLNNWLSNKLGPNRYFNSSNLTLQRQSKTNPHPTRNAVITWTDNLVSWLRKNPDLKFQSLNAPAKSAMKRGKHFTYLRMRDKL
ncbi:MAG: hypothetical protein NC338_01155 [Firmicutes bacterium]|nr:hypothetical protein [Bacillota bacterium]MCM1401701.1 hypothetical protein [Bacteroides sp.]MCM1477509.1 hypothetical protein [Bacteroides sp.]